MYAIRSYYGLLLGAIPLARAWRPSVGRVRLITAAGIAGGLIGLGVDLLADVNGEKTAVLIPTLGSVVGLGVGTALTSRRDVTPIPLPPPSEGLV